VSSLRQLKRPLGSNDSPQFRARQRVVIQPEVEIGDPLETHPAQLRTIRAIQIVIEDVPCEVQSTGPASTSSTAKQ
jgi:hypothetical protein